MPNDQENYIFQNVPFEEAGKLLDKNQYLVRESSSPGAITLTMKNEKGLVIHTRFVCEKKDNEYLWTAILPKDQDKHPSKIDEAAKDPSVNQKQLMEQLEAEIDKKLQKHGINKNSLVRPRPDKKTEHAQLSAYSMTTASEPELQKAVVYFDFDGTLTGCDGQTIWPYGICSRFETADTAEKRTELWQDEQIMDKVEQFESAQSSLSMNMTPKAVDMLKYLNEQKPAIKVVIVSRNYGNYILAQLEKAGISEEIHQHFTIYDRKPSRGFDNGFTHLGEAKNAAVNDYESQKGTEPGARFIFDDSKTDNEKMKNALLETETISHEEITAVWAAPGTFDYPEYQREIQKALEQSKQATDPNTRAAAQLRFKEANNEQRASTRDGEDVKNNSSLRGGRGG